MVHSFCLGRERSLKVKSIKPLGKQQVYNLSVASKCHNYVLANGTVSKNSASYAMVSYVTSYLKFNYPAEYMAALLTTTKNQSEATAYLNECRNMEIKVLPPSINKSRSEFKVESDDEVLYGLSSIRGIGPAIVKALIDTRNEEEYKSIYDFMRRCSVDVLNKATLEHLSRSGAFDELVPNQESSSMSRSEKMEILEMEKNELGLYITEHPLEGVWHVLESDIDVNIVDMSTRSDGETVTVGGVLSKVAKKTTRRGDIMYILNLEDITGTTEVVVFPNMVKDNVFVEGDIVLIKGRIGLDGLDEEHVVTKIYFTSMSKPVISEFSSGKPIIIDCTNKPTYDTVAKMKEIIDNHSGDCVVYLRFKDQESRVSLKFKKPTSDKARESLQLLGKASIDV
jgi:DNA polymerase III subunit alpha